MERNLGKLRAVVLAEIQNVFLNFTVLAVFVGVTWMLHELQIDDCSSSTGC